MAEQSKYPGKVPVSSYGNGGFRFGDVSHQGSLLLLPGGTYAWNVMEFSSLQTVDFEKVFLESGTIEFVLLGCGSQLLMPDLEIREAFDAHNIGLEFMSTGAAVRTYNVLLSEKRAVAAALIAVENP